MIKDKNGVPIHMGSICRWHDPEGESDPDDIYEVYEEPNDKDRDPDDVIIKMSSDYGETEALWHEVEVVDYNMEALEKRADHYIEQLGLDGILTATYRSGGDWEQVDIEADLDGRFFGTYDGLDDDDSDEEAMMKIKAWFETMVKPDLVSLREKIDKYV